MHSAEDLLAELQRVLDLFRPKLNLLLANRALAHEIAVVGKRAL